MGIGMQHTRSLSKRLFAMLVDWVLAVAVLTLLLLPWSHSPSSPLSINGGLLRFVSCDKGAISTTDGRPIKLGEGQSLEICSARVNLLFPSREAVITTAEGEELRLPVDETNRLRKAFDPTEMLLILVPLMAAAFEASRWSATPGKRLFGLLVRTTENTRPGFGSGTAPQCAEISLCLRRAVADPRLVQICGRDAGANSGAHHRRQSHPQTCG